jgi:hypothetical protein
MASGMSFGTLRPWQPERNRHGILDRMKVFAKQNPEGGQASPVRAFGASLARTTAGATLVPLRAPSAETFDAWRGTNTR